MDASVTFAELLQANRHRLVPEGSPLPKIVDIKFGKKKFSREDIYHQAISVTCDIAGSRSNIDLWAKYRPGIHEAFATLDQICRRLGEGVFPAPILEWHANGGSNSLLLTARIDGDNLRNKLMRSAVLRRTGTLERIFESNGVKMRKFHDASEPCGFMPIEELVEKVRALVGGTSFFLADEKRTVLRHVAERARTLRRLGRLPLRKLHHDWILRNILVDKNGIDYLVDFDSMRAPASSRWLEVMCLLLNVESQAKWSPLVTADMLSKLWQCFWRGYSRGGISECSPAEAGAALYLMRLCHLLGGTFRVPLFEKHTKFVDGRFIAAVKKSVLAGQYTSLHWTLSGQPTLNIVPSHSV